MHNNTVSKRVPHPDVVAKYFQNCSKVNTHNQSRQHDLCLEKAWVTRCGYFRLNTTIFGICVVDTWKTYRHHLTYRHRHSEIDLIEFVSILAKDLLENRLTRNPVTPPSSFNLRSILGREVHVPGDEQDPEVQAFEKLTQDSVYAIPGEDLEVDEIFNDAMPARSVEQGKHGLKKIDEFQVEVIQEKDMEGNMKYREVITT